MRGPGVVEVGDRWTIAVTVQNRGTIPLAAPPPGAPNDSPTRTAGYVEGAGRVLRPRVPAGTLLLALGSAEEIAAARQAAAQAPGRDADGEARGDEGPDAPRETAPLDPAAGYPYRWTMPRSVLPGETATLSASLRPRQAGRRLLGAALFREAGDLLVEHPADLATQVLPSPAAVRLADVATINRLAFPWLDDDPRSGERRLAAVNGTAEPVEVRWTVAGKFPGRAPLDGQAARLRGGALGRARSQPRRRDGEAPATPSGVDAARTRPAAPASPRSRRRPPGGGARGDGSAAPPRACQRRRRGHRGARHGIRGAGRWRAAAVDTLAGRGVDDGDCGAESGRRAGGSRGRLARARRASRWCGARSPQGGPPCSSRRETRRAGRVQAPDGAALAGLAVATPTTGGAVPYPLPLTAERVLCLPAIGQAEGWTSDIHLYNPGDGAADVVLQWQDYSGGTPWQDRATLAAGAGPWSCPVPMARLCRPAPWGPPVSTASTPVLAVAILHAARGDAYFVYPARPGGAATWS